MAHRLLNVFPMNAPSLGFRYAALAAILLGLPVAAACSAGSDATGSNASADSDDSELTIEFPEMYSAIIEGSDHEFKIPAKIDGVKNVKWSADPADAVSIEKQSDGSVMITMKKYYDKVTINAKAGSLKASAPLHMLKTTDDVWEQGSERYNNGVTFKRPDGGGGGHGDGGRPDGGWGQGERHIDPSLSCTNCHASGGKKQDIEHTPTQTGGYSDEDLINIFTKAEKPEGAEMRTGITLEKWQSFHQWKMEEDEKEGLVVYLRSLTPKSQGKVDFGGGIFGKGKGKGGHHDDDDKPTTATK